MITQFDNFINEEKSVRDLMKPKSEDEIIRAVKQNVINTFEKAYNEGNAFTEIDFYDEKYSSFLDDYFLCYELYQYKDKVFEMRSNEGGRYYTEFELFDDVDRFKRKMQDGLNKIKL